MSEKGGTSTILSKPAGNSPLTKINPIVASPQRWLNFRFPKKPDLASPSINSEGGGVLVFVWVFFRFFFFYRQKSFPVGAHKKNGELMIILQRGKRTRRPSLKQSKTSRKQKVGQVDKDERRGTALTRRGKTKVGKKSPPGPVCRRKGLPATDS